MAKVQAITKKTHAYIIEDGTLVREINPSHVEEYQKEKKQVYSCPATKTIDGSKVEVENFYVRVEDFVKRSTARQTVGTAIKDAISGKDLTGMTVAELMADPRLAVLLK